MLLLALLAITAISFYLLAKTCDKYFIPALDQISKRLNLSSDVAGATLMAVGSSAPELFISIISLLKPGHHEAIGMGTIVGSALFNLLVIIGAAAAFRPITAAWRPIVRDTAFYAIAIGILILAFHDGQILLYEAIGFITLYVVYVFTVLKWKAASVQKDAAAPINERTFKYTWLIFSGSILALALLSWLLVESAVGIAQILHVPEAIIALTILAIGTSIPDTLSSIIVARQGRGNMAITNAIGSNVFDILFGLGMPWFLALVFLRPQIPVNNAELDSSVLLLFSSIILIFALFILQRWHLSKWSGYLLVLLYIAYLTKESLGL